MENAFESRVRYRYSCHGRTRISGYRITGPLAAVLPSFVESGITGPETIRPDRILPEGLWLFAVLGFPRAIDLMVGVRWITARFSYRCPYRKLNPVGEQRRIG